MVGRPCPGVVPSPTVIPNPSPAAHRHAPTPGGAVDPRAALTDWELARFYEAHSDFQLLLEHKPKLRSTEFLDIGCGTGELFRYLRRYHPQFRYKGYDASAAAISKARWKYPQAAFEQCRPDLTDIPGPGPDSGVVWCRDVVQYQSDPFAFLGRLLEIPAEALVVRLRTRDEGSTVLDPALSCQWVAGTWLPYMVLNVEEALTFLRDTNRVRRATLVKRHVPLAGLDFRYLPKDCYDPATGTAETSMLLVRGRDDHPMEVATYERRQEGVAPPLFMRGVRYMKRRLGS